MLLPLVACYFLAACSGEKEAVCSDTPIDPLDSMIMAAKEVQKTVAGDSAISLYKNALEVAENQNRYSEQIYLNHKLAETYIFSSRTPSATEYLRDVKTLIKGHPEHHEEIGMAYTTLGFFHSNTYNYDSSLFYFDKALNYRLNHLEAGHEDIGNSYISLNYYYTYVRTEYDKALKYGQKALKLRMKSYGRESSEVAECYLNLAQLSNELGDHVKAIKYQEQVVQIFEKINLPNAFATLFAYSQLGKYHLAQKNYTEAQTWFEKVVDAKVAAASRGFQLLTGNSLADCFVDESPQKAYTLYQQTLDSIKNLYGVNNPIIVSTYLKIGKYLEKEEQYDSAILILDKADKVLQQHQSYIVNEYFNLNKAYSDIYLQTGQHLKAIPYIKKMVQIVLNRYDDLDEENGKNDLRVFADFDLYISYAQYGKALSKSRNLTNVKRSLKYFDAAIQILETLKKGYSTNLSRSQIAGSTTEVYESTIQTALRLEKETGDSYYQERAFLFAEKSKAFNLLNQVVNTKAKKFAGIPSVVLETEDSLNREITFYGNQLHQKARYNLLDSQQITNTKKRLFELERAYEAFVSELEQEYPEYYRLKRRNVEFKIKDIQARLKPDEALIEYFLGTEILTVFIITEKQFEVINENKSAILEKSIDNYYRAINKYDREQVEQNGNFLYKELVKPAVSKLSQTVSKLKIIPHGKLAYVPFDCLVNVDGPKESYLLQHFTLSYYYSSSIALERNERQQAAQDILIMAPVFDGQQSQLPPLTQSQSEAAKVSEMFEQNGRQVKYLNKKEATKSSFKKFARDYAIVHLATHAVVDRQNVNLSKIYFGNDEQEQLTLAETYDLKMDTDLLTLSSCESGIGQLQKGEGMMSFTRGFSYSGAQNIICSLWKVNDLYSAQIMSTLYKELLNGAEYDDAIRKAKLDLIQKSPNLQPKDWAGFILIRNNF